MPVGAPEGNQNAVKENRWWANTLKRALAQQNGDVIRDLAEKLIEKAREGDVAALREIGDRVDGKPKQETELSGDLKVGLASIISGIGQSQETDNPVEK